MKPDAIRDMSADQLQDQLIVLRKAHMDMRFEQASGQLKSSAALRQARRDLARVKTELRVRELASLKEKDHA